MNIFWMQAGGCGGDTWAMMNVTSPTLPEMIGALDVNPLWHPSLSTGGHADYQALVQDLVAGKRCLDILFVEGAVIRGPGGSGGYDSSCLGPKKDLVAQLTRKATWVVAAGTCASFGGIGADGEVEATGLQFAGRERGGFLGADFLSAGGHPVINLPGCPCQGEVLVGVLASLATGRELALNELQEPVVWYGMLVHQGCTRNEYHEYRVEDAEFGQQGCLFFHMGCRGPLTHGPCNKILWNHRNSKTRAGVPCLGCTQPEFPQPYPFFQTRNIADIPVELPEGVDRAHYLAYKGMAAAAAPQRLIARKSRV